MKKYALALLAPALLLVSHGYALPPDKSPDIELYISGSGAQDGSLENLMRLKAGVEGTPNICQEGSLDIYEGAIDGTRKRVYYCLTSEGRRMAKRMNLHLRSIVESVGIVRTQRGSE